ncbi:Spo7-domain-containing protein [Xylariaceae sp. FL1272]|nr:Spo7-domain-containing protein [Xylariaceae sp. FL1272]
MADPLDSIVKGAPQPGHDVTDQQLGTSGVDDTKPSDPLNSAPSSPSMIYLNMLILEASLRAQYLDLRARRRKHTFFLTLLAVWLVGFGYALFFAPREDGSGVGGSVYWVVEAGYKVCFIGGVMTVILVWATGIWDRGIRWPRRWFAIANRGLRGFNAKLVIMRRTWPIELMSTIVFFFTYGILSKSTRQYRYVDTEISREVDKDLNLGGPDHPHMPFINTNTEDDQRGHEEDLAPGGDYVKLLLYPKPFSPNFRENWEIYRNAYWERENERRALLRHKLQFRDKEMAKRRSPWFWWLPFQKRVEEKIPRIVMSEPEKGHRRRASLVLKEGKRTRSGSVRRGSISGGSSRTSTPPVDSDGGVSRKGSTGSDASEKKRKKHLSTNSKSRRAGIDSRSASPEVPSPLARESSFDSDFVS